MRTRTFIAPALLISLIAATTCPSKAADFSSNAELFSSAIPAATAIVKQARASLAQNPNEGETLLDPKTMSQLEALAQKIYQNEPNAEKKDHYWHTRFAIKVNAGDKDGKFALSSIMITVKPWIIETRCTTKLWRSGPCLYAQFSALQMTAVIYPSGVMSVQSDPGFGGHTQEEMMKYAKEDAVGFWLGHFSKPVYSPL